MVTGRETKPSPWPVQTDPSRGPRETRPTMFDLPSEDPEEPGLPDEFHYYQPQLLRETFRPSRYDPNRVFVGTDLNVYYNLQQPLWHKRPDWFAVLGVSRLYEERDLRLSYVIWQEQVAPFLVVELLSPGTESEDLGETERGPDEPPTKWEAYEQFLQIPYYVVFSRYTGELHFFELRHHRYEEVQPQNQRLWLPEAGLGLGLWSGRYQGIERRWLRFYNHLDVWLPTQQEQNEQDRQQTEQARQQAEQSRQQAEQADQRAEQADQRAEQADQRAEQARQQAEQADQRAERLAAQLKALGIEPEP